MYVRTFKGLVSLLINDCEIRERQKLRRLTFYSSFLKKYFGRYIKILLLFFLFSKNNEFWSGWCLIQDECLSFNDNLDWTNDSLVLI